MTDSQKAAREIREMITDVAYILESGDCTDDDRAEVEERIRQIIDKHMC